MIRNVRTNPTHEVRTFDELQGEKGLPRRVEEFKRLGEISVLGLGECIEFELQPLEPTPASSFWVEKLDGEPAGFRVAIDRQKYRREFPTTQKPLNSEATLGAQDSRMRVESHGGSLACLVQSASSSIHVLEECERGDQVAVTRCSRFDDLSSLGRLELKLRLFHFGVHHGFHESESVAITLGVDQQDPPNLVAPAVHVEEH